MHLIATYLPVFILWAFRTSENVPSPFFEIKRYSTRHVIRIKFKIGTYCAFLLFILITELQTSKDHRSAQSANLLRLQLELLFDVCASVQRVESGGLILLSWRQLLLLLVLRSILALPKLRVLVCSYSQSWHCSSEG
jgi:hypothetical protein